MQYVVQINALIWIWKGSFLGHSALLRKRSDDFISKQLYNQQYTMKCFFFKSDWLSMVQFSKVQFRKSNLVSKKLIKIIITRLALFDLLFIMKLVLN